MPAISIPPIPIPGRAVVAVSGVDAQGFLQNIVTTDVDALLPGEVRAGALLSPQGKILFDFLVSREGDGFNLDCRADIAADFAKRLLMYRLRAKVDFAVQEADVIASWRGAGDGDPSDAAGLLDTRFPADLDVRRRYGASADGGPAAWDALRVANGVAESGRDYALGDAFPHDVLLDGNGGVGFRKGCFVGQEVVSRMQHRGTARRRVLVAQGAAPLPPPGTEILAAGRALGTLGTVADRQAIALARIDRVAEAVTRGIAMTAGGVPLALRIPPGARFSFPDAQAAAASEP